MLIKKIVSLFTSLKLTVTLLAFSIVLVFVGTIAQADEGLYGAQAHYFKQWLVVGANFFGHKIPLLLPGGYLLGVLLVVNLVCAHIYRFQLTTKKLGIQLAHAGVVLLLVGQLATDMLAHEMHLRFSEKETRNYSDSATEDELVFRSNTEDTAIPAKMLKPGGELTTDKTGLPFTIVVKNYWRNSDAGFRAPMMNNGPTLTTNGIGASFDLMKAEDVKTSDDRNIPTAVLEFVTPSGSLGTWVCTEETLASKVFSRYEKMMGVQMAEKIAERVLVPQAIKVAGKQFTFLMRPEQIRHPFSLTLLKATHTVYPGTDIPKDFRSRVAINNPKTGEKREVEISMNHPLRYGGYTYYQYQMDAGQVAEEAGRPPSSVLSVVRNPSWLTPYIGCGMVGVGLMIQFFQHLIGFVTKQKKK